METRLTRVVHLDQPRPFRPLSESLIEADHNHMLTRIAEEKRAAEILASAQEAERLAQEEKRRKEEEAAAAAAAEEEGANGPLCREQPAVAVTRASARRLSARICLALRSA